MQSYKPLMILEGLYNFWLHWLYWGQVDLDWFPFNLTFIKTAESGK